MTIYSLLSSGIAEKIPMLTLIVGGVILLIAFTIGFAKGFRRVSWSGFVWVIAAVAFFAVEALLAENNFVAAALVNMGVDGKSAAFYASAIVMLAVIALALLLYGICTIVFRPKVKAVKKKGDRFETDENGIEYDPETADYDDYEKYNSTKILVRKGYGKPTLFGRILGGVICAVNVAAIGVTLGAIVLFLLLCTGLKAGVPAVWFNDPIALVVRNLAFRYGLDFLLVGVIVKTACNGADKGFLDGLRGLLVGVGKTACIGFAFYLPFSPFALPAEQGGIELVHICVGRCVDATAMMGIPADYTGIAGGVLAGLVLTVLILIVFALLNALLKALVSGVENVGFFRAIDTTLSVVVFLAIGVVICAAVWVGLAVLSYYGILNVDFLFKDASFSKELYEFCANLAWPWLETLAATISQVFPKMG